MLSFLGRGKPSDPPPEPSPAPDPPPASSAPPPPSAPPDFSDAKAVTIELVAELEGHDDRVWGMQWEPRGRCLASTSSDKTCRLWSQSAAAGGNWVTVAELEGVHNRTVRQVSWSPCGRLLATASFDASTAVWTQSGGDWECVAVVEGHENEVKSCAWSPSGTLLATCGRDKSVWIWELQPGNDFECVAVLNGHSQDVKCVTWHPTEDVLVSTSYDDTIKIWTEDPDGDDWSCSKTLSKEDGGHESTVWCASFEPGGAHRVVTCSDDRTIAVWNAAGPRGADLSIACKFPCGHDRPVLNVHWGRNGLIAAAGGDNSVRVYAAMKSDGSHGSGRAWAEVGAIGEHHEDGHLDDVNTVAWHPTDPTCLASCSDDGLIKIWKVTPAEE